MTLQLSTRDEVNIEYRALRQQLFEMGIEGATPLQLADAVIAIRSSKLPDPSVLPNAGSFFKNPVVSHKQFSSLLAHYPALVHYPQASGEVKLAAGWLLEKAGWNIKKTEKWTSPVKRVGFRPILRKIPFNKTIIINIF